MPCVLFCPRGDLGAEPYAVMSAPCSRPTLAYEHRLLAHDGNQRRMTSMGREQKPRHAARDSLAGTDGLAGHGSAGVADLTADGMASLCIMLCYHYNDYDGIVMDASDIHHVFATRAKCPAKYKKRAGAKAVKEFERNTGGGTLSETDATTYRATSARGNFLAQDRGDISFALKEW